MNASEDRAARMRAREVTSGLRLFPDAWAIVRMDGRGFSKLTAASFEKPADRRFCDLMIEAARAVADALQCELIYTQSDEISAVLPPQWELFDRRVEKIISLGAAAASAAFSAALGQPVQFDARVWQSARQEQVSEYMAWRSGDAARCALQNACYWALRADGLSAAAATSQLNGQPVSFKNELLFARGINFNELPVWQRRGVLLSMQQYEKTGHNPITGEDVVVTRRRLETDWAIPTGDAFAALIDARCDALTAKTTP